MKISQNIFVFTLLISLIFAPPLLTGFSYYNFAEHSIDQKISSIYYQKAAALLFWNTDILEKAGLLSNYDIQRQINLLTTVEKKYKIQDKSKAALGNAFFQTGQIELSNRYYREILNSSNPELRIAAYQKLTDYYHSQNLFDKELTLLQKWLVIEPANDIVLEKLGLIYSAYGYDTGIQFLLLAKSLIKTNQYDQLIEALKINAIRNDYRLIKCGQALAQLGEWSLAEVAFTETVKLNPNYGEAWAWLGYSRYKSEKIDPIHFFERAEILKPGSPLIRSLIGSYWMEEKNYQQSIIWFQKSIMTDPSNPNVWISYANALSYQDISKALNAYLYAVKLDPKSEISWYNLASFCANNNIYLEEYGLSAALTVYSLNPQNSESSDILGLVNMGLGHYISAEVMFKKALQLTTSARSSKYHYHLGLLYFYLNRIEESKKEFLESVTADPFGSFGLESNKFINKYFP